MSIFKKGEIGTWVVPPKIQAIMTGVTYAFVIHPRYRLHYEDGSVEEAALPDDVSRESTRDFLHLVNEVQKAARAEK